MYPLDGLYLSNDVLITILVVLGIIALALFIFGWLSDRRPWRRG